MILVRVDASTAIGTGHAMRMLALSDALRACHSGVEWITAALPEDLEHQLSDFGIRVGRIDATPGSPEDRAATRTRALSLGALWVVLDGYAFREEFIDDLRAAGLKTLIMDDMDALLASGADLVVNGNLMASSAPLVNPGHALRGPRYAPLRREFRPPPSPKPPTPAFTKVLVTLGGSDPGNATRTVLEALSALGLPLDVKVVIGSQNPHRASLETFAARSGYTALVDVFGMRDLMDWADLAISGAGSTILELMRCQVPTLAISIAGNQVKVAQALAASGAGVDLGWADEGLTQRLVSELRRLHRDSGARGALATRAASLVDGAGCSRLAEAMARYPLRVRPAMLEDAEALWAWASDPHTRAMSFTPEAIPWPTHLAWFARKLGDPDCTLLIGELPGGLRVGQARLDRRKDDWVVSVGLSPSHRGQGLGVHLIRAACVEAESQAPEARVFAYILPVNTGSIAVFRKAGFTEPVLDSWNGLPCLVMQWEAGRRGVS